MKTIAIANQKGGTGKTTTTYNLGIALTQQGYRVLMVDFDPQGNLSCYCGIPPEKDLDQTITELLMKTSCEKPIGNRECVYQTGRKEAAARVDFIPSNLRLAGFELAMGTMMCREVLLKSCLEQYNNQYDYCLIDCSPSVGLLLTNALAAANEIIIPMQAQPFSVVGMSQLTSSIANVQRNLYSGTVYALDVYESNQLAAVCTEADSGLYTFLSARVAGDAAERYQFECEQKELNTDDGASFHLTVTDMKNPDAELCTPSRDENTTVQRAAAYNAPAAAAPSATPTPEPTSSQPVQQSKKSVNPFWNVLDFLPIAFTGAGLFWFRQKNRRGGPKG